MTSPFSRFKYQGAAPGADSNNYELFNSTTWQTPSTSNLFAQLGIHKVFFDIQNVAAGTLKLYKSQDAGANWVQVHQEAVAASTTETVQREWLVESYSDFKAVWANGGSAQTTFSVDMALVNQRAGSGITSGGSSGDASAANQTNGNQKTQVVDAAGNVMPTKLTPYSSAALEASSILKPSAGALISYRVRLDASAPSGTYYLQFFNAATLPANATAPTATLPAPVKIVHTLNFDDYPSEDAMNLAFSTGCVVALSSTEFTLTVSGAYLSTFAQVV